MDLYGRKHQRQRTGRLQHLSFPVQFVTVKIFRMAGLGVGHSDPDPSLIAAISLPVERIEFVRNLIKYKISSKNTFFFPPVSLFSGFAIIITRLSVRMI